ncbi:MAG: hypothetical protein ACI9OJ_004467 [Myxococcota bacterium]|jgi:hypothetical protein
MSAKFYNRLPRLCYLISGHDVSVKLPSMAELPDEARRCFEHFRSLPAGRFALRMFAEHRRDPRQAVESVVSSSHE